MWDVGKQGLILKLFEFCFFTLDTTKYCMLSLSNITVMKKEVQIGTEISHLVSSKPVVYILWSPGCWDLVQFSSAPKAGRSKSLAATPETHVTLGLGSPTFAAGHLSKYSLKQKQMVYFLFGALGGSG